MIFPIIVLLACLNLVLGIDLNVNSDSQSRLASIHEALAVVAQGLFSYYNHSHVGPGTKKWEVGLFPFPPYYWWESGAVWGAMVDYWAYTGDSTYVDMTLDGLAAQVGPRYDYIMPQQRTSEGNDDQQWWTHAVLSALEQGFPPLPCPEGAPECPTSYLALASKVFEEMVNRWRRDSSSCHGGLRWQYNSSHNGYGYKNSVTNSGFFSLAARLAKYTGQARYASWAEKIWNWEASVGLIAKRFRVYDGTNVATGCTDLDTHLWSYNAGIPLYGAAIMYNITNGSKRWRTRVQGLLQASEGVFFSPFRNATGIMYEYQCEKASSCNTDQHSFKAYLSRYLGKTGQVAPFLHARIHGLMQSTAIGAAKSCSGGTDGSTCGTKWYTSGWDGTQGLGQQLSALEAIQALLR